MQVKWLLASAAGLCVYGGSVYATMMLVRGSAPKPSDPIEPAPCPACAARTSKQFNELAAVYDSKVLETSAGTGRNIGYYPEAVDEVVFTDVNEKMLRQAKGKWERGYAGQYQHHAAFIVSDVQNLTQETMNARQSETKTSRWAFFHRLMSPHDRQAGKKTSQGDHDANHDDNGATVAEFVSLQPSDDFKTAVLAPGLQYTFPAESFDCCIDTFGLCSCTDPVQALMEMSRVVKPAGRIILLEHGRSYWTFLNNILDSDAALHYKKWGCWWNRDILDVVAQVSEVAHCRPGKKKIFECRRGSQ